MKDYNLEKKTMPLKIGKKVRVLPNKKIGTVTQIENGFIILDNNPARPYLPMQLQVISAHEQLLEMGYAYEEHKQGHRYTRENEYIDIDLFRDSFYHFTMSPLTPAGTDLALAHVLMQYLEELRDANQ